MLCFVAGLERQDDLLPQSIHSPLQQSKHGGEVSQHPLNNAFAGDSGMSEPWPCVLGGVGRVDLSPSLTSSPAFA